LLSPVIQFLSSAVPLSTMTGSLQWIPSLEMLVATLTPEGLIGRLEINHTPNLALYATEASLAASWVPCL